MSAKDTTPNSRPQLPRGSASGVKTGYLTLYNFASAVLWVTVLGRTALTASRPAGTVYGVTGEFVKWTQTLALMEVGHSLFGEFRDVCFCGNGRWGGEDIGRFGGTPSSCARGDSGLEVRGSWGLVYLNLG